MVPPALHSRPCSLYIDVAVLFSPRALTISAGPEVMSGGAGTVATSTDDIYSLGVVMWELATLEVPQLGGLRAPQVPRECPQQVAVVIHACVQV